MLNPYLIMERLALTLFLFFGIVLPSQAGLINATSASGGTVVDTINNREWLDLEVTDTLSPDLAIATYAPDGWHWASASEVSELLDQFFMEKGPDVPGFRPTPDAGTPFLIVMESQATAWIDLFGATTTLFSGGFYDDGVIDSNQEAMFWNLNRRIPIGGATHVYINASDTGVINSSYGVFLTRGSTVAEPSTFALIGLTLISLSWSRRRST